MEVAAQKAMSMLHQYTSQELANTLWALATLEHYPGAAMLDAAAVQIARRIEQFSPQVIIKPNASQCCRDYLIRHVLKY